MLPTVCFLCCGSKVCTGCALEVVNIYFTVMTESKDERVTCCACYATGDKGPRAAPKNETSVPSINKMLRKAVETGKGL